VDVGGGASGAGGWSVKLGWQQLSLQTHFPW
jgi:hypothetical protein